MTEFGAPIEIVFSNPAGGPADPGHLTDGATWRTIPPLTSSAQRDGFSRNGSDVHVWTRHLSYFGLMLDGEVPTEPRDLGGVVAEDGLTLRWIPGSDASGQMGNVTLYVNGEPYGEFGPTEFEAKLGAFAAGDTRSFTLAQKDAAGNVSRQTPPLRAVPVLAGKSLTEAPRRSVPLRSPSAASPRRSSRRCPRGRSSSPRGSGSRASSPIDIVVARGVTAPQTRLAFSIAGSSGSP